jgi:CRP-like cAMP-binding protein
MRYSNGKEELIAEDLTLTLPISTPVPEVLDKWILAVVARVGTQRGASHYLGMAPETISRRLNHRRRQKSKT